MEKHNTNQIDARGLLNTLKYFPQGHMVEPIFIDSETYFIKHLQEFLVLYNSIIKNTKSRGEMGFAVRYLISGCFNDLICAYHLAKYGYFIQSFAIFRRIYEATDLVELFKSQPSYAKTWVEDGQKAINELSPKNVRKKIGKAKYDPLYSLLCEQGAHPTFKSHPSIVYIEKNIEKDTTKIVTKIGSAFFNSHQAFFTQLFSLFSFYLILQQILTGITVPEDLLKDIIGKVKMLLEDTRSFADKYWIQYVKMDTEEEANLKARILKCNAPH